MQRTLNARQVLTKLKHLNAEQYSYFILANAFQWKFSFIVAKLWYDY